MLTATIAHHAMNDLLHQMSFPLVHMPEVVELAVILTGLGQARNQIGLVKQTQSYWDPTIWDAFPRPFLDVQCLAYANALSAWSRNHKSPEWMHELESDIRGPMAKSLKYLFKTGDSYFHHDRPNPRDSNQAFWLDLAQQKSNSCRIIAVRHFEKDDELTGDQVQILIDNLRSHETGLITHSITAIENLLLNDKEIIEELRLLIENRDEVVQSKAMIALAKFAALDELALETAAKMVDSRTKFVTYSGMTALASLNNIDELKLRVIDRAFCRSLQGCDYDFVGLFAAAYIKWLDDPKGHLTKTLSGDFAEYLDIGLDAIDNAKEQLVALD